MATTDLAALVVLNELMDSDDEKPRRGKTQTWIKRREEKGYFNNIRKLKLKIDLGSGKCLCCVLYYHIIERMATEFIKVPSSKRDITQKGMARNF